MSYSPHAFGITEGQSAANKFYLADDNGDIEFQDDDKVWFGADQDVSLFWDHSNSVFKIGTDTSGKAITIGHATSEVTVADNLTVTGDLTVTGTTTTVDTVTMNAANAVVFEGVTADAFETTLTIIDPTTPSKTIYLPNANGYLPVLAVASTTAITSTPEELNKIDGGTARVSCTIVDADGILVNDGGTMKMVLASELKTYASGGGETAADDITTGDAAVTITTSVGNITIDAAATDADIIFKVDDADEVITALTLDGSEAGAATFNSTVTATGFTIGSAAITEVELEILDGASVTTAELNLLDGSVAGTVVNSKAVIYSAAGIVQGTDLKVPDGGGIHNATVPDMIKLDAAEVVFKDGNYTVDIASHDEASYGLKLADTLVTSSAAELNIVDGGTAATSTTLADADRVVVNDNGAMVQVALSDFETYFETALDTLSNVTTVGALNAGSITSGFGNIDNGASTITTTGLISGGSLDIDDVVINGSTIGHTDDTDLITVADGVVTVAGEISVTTLDIGGTDVTSTAAELNILDGVTATASQINHTVSTVTSATAISATSSRYILADTTGGSPITVTLNADVANGTTVTIKKKTNDGHKITIASADNIDGGAGNVELNYQNEAVTFISDGADWYAV